MASHSFWKGYLKLSLVTCPVTMGPATSESDRVRFHVLNAKTGNRVISRYVDAASPVAPWISPRLEGSGLEGLRPRQ